MANSDGDSISQEIIRYHEETKHHYDRYARSLGYMDWDNQYQSLYHFTIGKPVEDPHLTTYPPYHHLSR